MPKIFFTNSAGTINEVQAENGKSIMEAAVDNIVSGIDADCGGACACATCHVYVEKEWLALLSPKNEMEESMIEFAEDVRENSRLSCQLIMSDKLDGIKISTPESQ